MALDVTSASTDRDLTTTSALKAMVLGATATSTAYDAHLSNLIRRASRQAETFLGYPLTVQTYRETIPGFGSRRLMLSRTPIRAIKALYTGTSTADDTQVETSDFIVEDAEAGLLARDQGFSWSAALQYRGNALSGGDAIPLEPGPVPGQERRPWLVDYVAGYTYDGVDTGSTNWSTEAGTTSTGRTLPEDIEAAIIARANAIYENNDGVAGESLGDLKVTYARNFQSAADDLEAWQEMLAPYRRVA